MIPSSQTHGVIEEHCHYSRPDQYHHPADVVTQMDPGLLHGTRVTLINLPIREQASPNNPPLGPALLAARLRQHDVEVSILDLNAYRIRDEDAARRNLPGGRVLNMEEIDKLLFDHLSKAGDQDMIAMSGLITTLAWQSRLARMIRHHQPQTMIASGGGLATEFREILFPWIPELDAIAHSEGDDVILKMAHDARLMRNLGQHQARLSGKLAPYFLGDRGGRSFFYYDGGRPRNLDALPLPAWDLLEQDAWGNNPLEQYILTPVWGAAAYNSSAAPFTMKRSLSMISSRGCPFACRFCFRGAQGERNYGVRSARSVIDEMLHNHEQYGVDFVGIVDDNFMVRPDRIVELAKQMRPILQSHDLRWGTHGRLDEAADLRSTASGNGVRHNPVMRVEKMREAGCVYIGFGAESASPSVLEAMGKGGFILTNGATRINGYDLPLTMVEGIKTTKANGVHANCTWIMGYPGETLEDLKTSVAFIKWQEEFYTQGLMPGTLQYDIARKSVNRNMFMASAYPGTEMFDHPRVRERIGAVFGVNFAQGTGKPIPDQNFYNYVCELDDATKVLNGEGGTLYYGQMELDRFLEARELVEQDRLYEILEM